MTTKQVLFRLNDSKLIAFDNKLSDKGISKQFFLSKCVELFLEDKLSFDNNVIANDSSEIADLKKQIAIILERLDKIEDNKVIASDNSPIQSRELIGVENIEVDLVDRILTSVKQKEDNTEKSTLSECDILPSNEVLPHNIPETETGAVNGDNVSVDDETVSLNDKQKDILERMKDIESGRTLKSQGELARFLDVNTADITKLKKSWENKLFSVQVVKGSHQLTRL